MVSSVNNTQYLTTNYLTGSVEFQGNAQASDSVFGTNSTNSVSYGEAEYYESTSGEKCTDGKDDGKIGLGSAIFNAGKGILKTIGGGIKGMFTNKEGKFSLGKTLLSAATAAACIAFPAVGLAFCAVGAVAGTVQVGKGIAKAATATTDAEAKEAWQNIGGGAFTVATSVAGAKASLGAVKATSTAGAKGGSALAELGKDASLLKKAGALTKDCVSSTGNNAKNIAQTATALRQNVANKNLESANKKLDLAQRELADATELLESATEADDILAGKQLLKEANTGLEKATKTQAKTQAKVDKLSTKTVSDTAKANAKSITEGINGLKETKTSLTNGAKETIKHPVQSAKSAFKSGKGAIESLGDSFSKAKKAGLLKTAGKNFTEAQTQVVKFLNEKNSVQAAVDQFGYAKVADALIAAGVTTSELYNTEIA